MTKKSDEIAFEDVVLRPVTGELLRAGSPVAVEPQVFDLIRFMAQNPDRLLTRDDLVDAVWGGRIVSDQAISSRVSAARTVLGDDGKAQRIIRTVPRRGFRFVAEPRQAGLARQPVQSAPTAPDIRFVRASDGVNLAHTVLGDGPVLVKTASFLNHIEHEQQSPIWRHWVDEISSRARFVRYDQRGCGLSDWEVDDISFDGFVRDLEAVTDGLELERFTVLGISQGAAVAVAYARRHPERVNGLILIGGYAAGWRRLGLPDFQARREALLDLVPVGWGSKTEAFHQLYSSLFFPGGGEEIHASFNTLQKVATTPGMAWRILNCLGDLDVRPLLSDINCPVLVMHSRGDEIVPFAAGKALAAAIPRARFLPLESANHVLLEGDPGWPRCVEAMERFLSELNV